MKIHHAQSLILVWRVAQIEAQKLEAASLEPIHLILGLAKIVDLDFTELVPKETKGRDDLLEELLREARRLRAIFRLAGLDPQVFRRRLRRCAPAALGLRVSTEPLHRTAASKQAFSEAAQFAELTEQSLIYPVHVLLAVLNVSDEARDEVLLNLKVEKKRLLELTRQEVFLGEISNPTVARKVRVGRN